MTASVTTSAPTTPGLFDFQVNGFAGVDFQSDALTATALRRAVDALAADGGSGIFLTLITAREDALCTRFRRIEEMRASDPVIARMVPGYHLEGPWLRAEPGYCGAHPLELMCAPTIAAFDKLQSAAGGRIKLVTLAPEWPGSADFISHLTQQGVHVSIGHSNASDVEIDAAIRAGARFVLQNLFRAKPRDRVLFTTDAMSAAGAPPGRYALGTLEVAVGADGIVRGPNGGFAGSSLTPQQGVKRIASFLHLDAAAARAYWSTAATTAFGETAHP
jgi:N-acetylglucosamine-6-phosphate deacetylase